MDGGAVVAQQHTKGTAPKPSLFDVVKVLLRLGPKQINDEIALAISQMKTKGVAAGIAAALVVVGLVFLTFLVIALIVAAIAGFYALGFQLWAASLIVAGIFLVIAAIFALIGLLKLKKTMPLVPEDAIRGFRLDLGVVTHGGDFGPADLDRIDAQKRRDKEEAARKAAEQKKRQAKTAGVGEPKKPSYTELLRRTALRRDHIAGLQEQITARLPRKKTADDELAVSPVAPQAPPTPTQAPPPAPAAEGPAEKAGPKGFVATRWKPLSVVAGSTAAAGVFLRELIKK